MVLDVKMQIHPIIWVVEESSANDELGWRYCTSAGEHFDYDSHHIMYVLGPRNNRPSNYVVSNSISAKLTVIPILVRMDSTALTQKVAQARIQLAMFAHQGNG